MNPQEKKKKTWHEDNIIAWKNSFIIVFLIITEPNDLQNIYFKHFIKIRKLYLIVNEFYSTYQC